MLKSFVNVMYISPHHLAHKNPANYVKMTVCQHYVYLLWKRCMTTKAEFLQQHSLFKYLEEHHIEALAQITDEVQNMKMVAWWPSRGTLPAICTL